MSPALTLEAEAACALINRTLGSHKTVRHSLGKLDRSRRLRPPSEDQVDIQCQATLVRMIGITEAFCGERLLISIEDEIAPERSVVLSKIWDQAAVRATQTWVAQAEAYRDWADVRPSWTDVKDLADARNAVAHGLGKLTRRQRSQVEKITAKLSRFDISVRDYRVILTEPALEKVAHACIAHIREVDVALQVARPSRS